MTSGIYRIDIGPNFYIGSSIKIESRIRAHFTTLQNASHDNPRMQRSWTKYSDFQFEILKECSTEILLTEEQNYLDIHFDDKSCMNMLRLSTTTLGLRWSDESRARASVAALNRSPEGKANIAFALKNKTPEHIENMRQAALRRTSVPWWTGRKHSEESRRKMSEKLKGRPGRKHSPETIAKMRASYRRRIGLE